MKKTGLYFFLAFILLSDFAFLQAQTTEPGEMRNAIVKIRGPGNQVGTGFVFYISREDIAYVMTARHVVESFDIENNFEINFIFSDQIYNSRVRWDHQSIDLAILSLYEYPSEIQSLVLGKSTGSREGKRAYIHGFPGGNNIQRDDGSIRALSGNSIELDDITPDKGNSGGPLICELNNQVIGMIIQKSYNPSDQYAIKIDQIKLFIEDIEILRPVLEQNEALACDDIPPPNGPGEDGPVLGFGILGVTKHPEPLDIYVGNPATVYLEIHLAVKLKDLKTQGLSWGLEPSIGVDLVRWNPLVRGTIAANGFVNAFISWEPDQYSFTTRFGFGIGGTGIKYDYDEGDGVYEGTGSYKTSDIDYAANLFGELAIPLSDRMNIFGLLRYTFTSGKFDFSYKGEIDFGNNELYTPQGKLLGLYFVGGFEFDLRRILANE